MAVGSTNFLTLDNAFLAVCAIVVAYLVWNAVKYKATGTPYD